MAPSRNMKEKKQHHCRFRRMFIKLYTQDVGCKTLILSSLLPSYDPKKIWERETERYFNTLNIYICFAPNIVLVNSLRNISGKKRNVERRARRKVVLESTFSFKKNLFTEFTREVCKSEQKPFFLFRLFNRNNKKRVARIVYMSKY